MDNITDALKNLGALALKTVEKDVEKSKQVTKPKILKINTKESIVEGNFVEMPFISYNKRKEPITVIEYTWTDAVGNKHGIEVRGSKYGVPTSYDFDVLLALQRIHVKNVSIEYDRHIMDENEISDKEVIINFSIAEVAREMGYKSVSKNIYEKIRKSIETLIDTTIYNRHSGGLYDISQKSYVSDSTIGYHIIEYFKSYSFKSAEEKGEKRVRGQEVRDHTMVKLNKFFYRSIANSYFKYFNYEIFKELRSGVGRKLFLLLNKWRNGKSFLKIKYDTLYERIPLDESIPKFRRNETIKNAGQELLEVGFVKNIEYTREYIRYIFTLNELAEDNESTSYNKRYNTIAEVVSGLLEFGLSEEETQEVLGKHLANMSYLKALLRYVYILKVYEKINDNVKGYLLKGLSEKYDIDEKYYD